RDGPHPGVGRGPRPWHRGGLGPARGHGPSPGTGGGPGAHRPGRALRSGPGMAAAAGTARAVGDPPLALARRDARQRRAVPESTGRAGAGPGPGAPGPAALGGRAGRGHRAGHRPSREPAMTIRPHLRDLHWADRGHGAAPVRAEHLMTIRTDLRELRDDQAEAVLITAYGLADLEELGRLARGRRHPLLPLLVDGALTLAGPVQLPEPGVCPACAETRRLAAFGTAVPVKAPELRLGGIAAPAFHDTLSALSALMLTEPELHRDVVYALRTDHGSFTRHRVTPRDGCRLCPSPAPGTPDARVPVSPGSPSVSSTPPVSPGSLRSANSRTDGPRLRDALVDSRYGPVTAVRRTGHLPLATVAALLAGDPAGNAAGYGRTPDFAQSERVALFEAVERLGGIAAGGRPARE